MKKETLDEKIGTVVGYVLQEGTAIDFTPIIKFVITKPLQPGDLFEWDNAEKELIYKGNSTRRA